MRLCGRSRVATRTTPARRHERVGQRYSMTGARAAGPSRRHLLLGGAAGLATAGSLGGCAAERAPDAGATGRDAAVERVTARRRFRGRHQPGLDDQPQPHAAFVSCTLAQPFDRDSLARLLRILTDDIERLMDGRGPLTEQEPEMASRTAALTITVGIGPALVAAAGQPVPQWLTGLPGFAVDRLEPRWNGGDLLLQICADSPVTVAHAQRRLLAGLRSLGGPAWVQRGFREPFEGPGTPMRNLFGQIDGTVQPEVRGSERDLLWVGEDGPEWLRDGTTMVIRRIRMDLDTWDAVDRVGRENAIGRTLDTGAPLSAPRASATETSDLAAKDTEWADVCRGVVTEADLQLALVAGDEDAVVRGRDGRHPLVGVSGVVLEHLGEAVGDACVDPEPPHLGVPCDAGAGSGDEGVVTVEGHAAGGLRGEGCEETRGVVDLGEAVELVAGDVEQECVGGSHDGGEAEGVGLVELEDGDVGTCPAREGQIAQQGGDDSPGEVAPGWVGEDGAAVGSQQRHEHLRRSRLAVGSGDDDDATADVGQGVREEGGVDPLDHQARHRRPSTPLESRRDPGGLAGNDGGGGPLNPPG